MAQDKFPVSGRSTIWMIVGQGPIALAVAPTASAIGPCPTGLFGHFYSHLSSLLCLPVFGRQPEID